MKISPAGIALIKEFEGCYLTAYNDPGTGGEPYTIGYGSTEGVYWGMTITAEQAEEMLTAELAGFEKAVEEIIPLDLSQPEFDALVSFAYNCGSGALASSTMRRRLLAGEPRCKVYQEEMPRWNKGGNGVMPGLTRRRQAEADMACSGVNAESEERSFLEQAALYYEQESHQKAAWRSLEAALDAEVLEAFKAAYRGTQSTPKPFKPEFPLDVEYFYQLDSKTGHGERSCFSSSMAMALEYVDSAKFGGMDDDDYLAIVFKYGDTVSSTAQVQAAESLGYQASFHTDGTEQRLLDLLDSGTPVPIGVLHKGPVGRPSGGGHWVCLVGYDETHFWCGDPFGEMDVVNGGYVSSSPLAGDRVKYSRKNLMRRWLIDGSGADGWYVSIS